MNASSAACLLALVPVLATRPLPVGASPIERAPRLLVVFAPDGSDGRLAAQRDAYERSRAGSQDRDLRLVEAVGPGRQADAMRARFSVAGDGFRVVLVGRDGGAKLESDAPLPAEAIFAAIDAMPMRRAEMRSRTVGGEP